MNYAKKCNIGNLIGLRGQRLRSLRNALKITRVGFAAKHNIPRGTLQNWEDGRHNGLSTEGAMRIIQALSNENVHCSVEWLMDGTGEQPSILGPETQTSINQEKIRQLSEPQIIQQELLLFHKLNEGGVDTIVRDNSMFPAFHEGDLVAGKRYFNEAIIETIDNYCIVQTNSGETLIRQVQKGLQKDCYDLIINNKQSNDQLYKNVSLFWAAPILWLRRKRRPQY